MLTEEGWPQILYQISKAVKIQQLDCGEDNVAMGIGMCQDVDVVRI